MRWAFLFAGIIGCCLPGRVFADEKPVWLAIATPELAPSLQPLADRRAREGFGTVVATEDVARAINELKRPAYILLVGDVPAPGELADPAWQTPTREYPRYRWRKPQREKFASDSMYGELDGDLLPDVPVGRIPARNRAEVTTVVRKILAYEDRPWSLNDLALPFWAGAPGYGGAIDRLATGTNLVAINAYLPRWIETSLIAADESSAFCGWPDDHAATFNRLLRRGGLVAAVGAHGAHDSFFSMSFQDRWCGYQQAIVERDLANGSPMCPLLLFTCESGNFAGPQRCLTESLLLAPGGPVVVAGATTESHPLTNTLTGLSLMRELDSPRERFGDVWLAGFRSGYRLHNLILETILKDVEGKLEPQINQALLRRDELRMYALLGDPATRIRLPRRLNASLERSGNQWRWEVERPASATELHVGIRGPQMARLDRPAEIDRNGAQVLFEKTNAAMFAFKPFVTLGAGAPWKGTADESSELRLVAFAPDAWYAAVLATPASD